MLRPRKPRAVWRLLPCGLLLFTGRRGGCSSLFSRRGCHDLSGGQILQGTIAKLGAGRGTFWTCDFNRLHIIIKGEPGDNQSAQYEGPHQCEDEIALSYGTWLHARDWLEECGFGDFALRHSTDRTARPTPPQLLKSCSEGGLARCYQPHGGSLPYTANCVLRTSYYPNTRPGRSCTLE